MTLCPIYAITDPTLLPGPRLITGVQEALRAGVRTIQYRNKHAHYSVRITEARALLALCNNFGAELIINDDVQLALDVGAHGVHLGQEDTPLAQARSLLGQEATIGVTCHNRLDLAQTAQNNGASYVAFGRLYSSSTKPDASTAPLSIIAAAKSILNIPVVAIGGITHTNMIAVFAEGADAVAVCESAFGKQDTFTACSILLETWNTHYV